MFIKSLASIALAATSLFAASADGGNGPPSKRHQAHDILGQILAGRDTLRGSGRVNAEVRGNDRIPPGQRPPAGMCRVWIVGVPPGRQPAVTDCATAQAQAATTANARVIYGDESAFPGKANGKFGKHDRDSHVGGDVSAAGSVLDRATDVIRGRANVRSDVGARVQPGRGRGKAAGSAGQAHGRGRGVH